MTASSAGIAQLVEHNLAKVGVARSSLVSRSMFPWILCLFRQTVWLSGRVVMQQPAKLWTSVRFRPQPPHNQ